MSLWRSDKARDRLIAVLLMLGAALYYLAYVRYGINLADDGFFMNRSERVLRGERVFADFHTHYTPGSYYLAAVLFKLFGADLWTARWMWFALRVLTAGLLYLVARRVTGRVGAIAAAAVATLVPGHWHKTYFLFLPLLNLECAFRYYDGRRARWLLALGASTALGALFLTDFGLA
ncbi:MAG: glycosyltransferase family 39 protein, partial [Candidatus Methylomirabilis sp.]|nr:glycosyltransferase family 39 protein [Deltaproteobacteria bacterium]